MRPLGGNGCRVTERATRAGDSFERSLVTGVGSQRKGDVLIPRWVFFFFHLTTRLLLALRLWPSTTKQRSPHSSPATLLFCALERHRRRRAVHRRLNLRHLRHLRQHRRVVLLISRTPARESRRPVVVVILRPQGWTPALGWGTRGSRGTVFATPLVIVQMSRPSFNLQREIGRLRRRRVGIRRHVVDITRWLVFPALWEPQAKPSQAARCSLLAGLQGPKAIRFHDAIVS